MPAKIDQLISFWQSKLEHDDANLIAPTARVLIIDTIDALKKLEKEVKGNDVSRL